MAGRGRASSQKRQKEMARLEKRQQKAQRKQERKLGIGGKEESDLQDETLAEILANEDVDDTSENPSDTSKPA
jgi:hypothetical protein